MRAARQGALEALASLSPTMIKGQATTGASVRGVEGAIYHRNGLYCTVLYTHNARSHLQGFFAFQSHAKPIFFGQARHHRW